MDNRITELRQLLDQAHEVMRVQVVGLQRMKRERNTAEGLIERALKVLLPHVANVEDPELLSLYGAIEDHVKLIGDRRRG